MNCEQISQSIGKSFTFFYEPDMLCPHLIKLYKENHKKFPQRPLGKSRWFHLDCECCKPPETLSFFQGHTEFLLEILPDFRLFIRNIMVLVFGQISKSQIISWDSESQISLALWLYNYISKRNTTSSLGLFSFLLSQK